MSQTTRDEPFTSWSTALVTIVMFSVVYLAIILHNQSTCVSIDKMNTLRQELFLNQSAIIGIQQDAIRHLEKALTCIDQYLSKMPHTTPYVQCVYKNE